MKQLPFLVTALLIAAAAKSAFTDDWSRILPEGPRLRSMLQGQAAVEESTTEPLNERQQLGKDLFFDPVLSINGKVSCSTCHNPNHGYASTGKPIGLDGVPLPRKAPSLYNCKANRSFFWDGHAGSLEEQVSGPLLSRKEMGNVQMSAVIERLQATDYRERFVRIYGGLSGDALTNAIAEFERTISIDSPLDAYLDGPGNFTPSEARGYQLFRGKANCYKCHVVTGGRELTDHRLHNTGIGGIDYGLWNRTRKNGDEGKFKTPQLRGVRNHPPYMHDGSVKTLEDVVEFYDKGGNRHDVGLTDASVSPLGLSKGEKEDLLAFLKVL